MATFLPTHRAAIVNLYNALFNRAPDASGLAFWAQAYADGASPATIAQSFMGTIEGRAAYPTSQTSTQFVADFYQTVFGRLADADGLAFWTQVLDAAGGAGSDAARAALVGQIVGVVSQPLNTRPDGLSDAAYAQTLVDRALFANKAVVGDYVASLNIDDVALARQVLALVTADVSSVAVAKAFAASGGVTPMPPVPGLSITNADSELNIVSKFAAYTGNVATVDATGMSAAKLAAVAGGVTKIAAGGIGGVLGLSVVEYAGAVVTMLAPKLAAGATLTVTGTAGADTIALREFHRATTIDGGAGVDTLNLSVTGLVPDALQGVSLDSIESLSLQTSGGAAGLITTLDLSTSIQELIIDSNDGIGITALSGGDAAGVAITVAGSGTIGFVSINAAVTIFDASGASGILAASFSGSAQQVKGGSGNNTLLVSGASTLTGGASADVFGLMAGVALTGVVDNASLLAKVVTITDFGSGDRIQVATEVVDTPGDVETVVLIGGPVSIYDAAVEALANLRLVSATAPYVGFAYAGDTYILVDRGVVGVVGAGDMLIKLSGSVSLAGVSYDETGLLTMA